MKQPRCLPAILGGVLLIALPLLAQNSGSNPQNGTLNGRQYINSYFGFAYHLPEAWSGNVAQSTTASQVYPLLSASPPNTGKTDVRRVVIQAEYLGQNSSITTGKDFLDIAIPLLTGTSSEFEALPGDTHYTFDGKGFDRMDLRSKPAPGRPILYQAQVCTVLRGFVLTFQFIGASQEDLETLMYSMGFLRFTASSQSSASPATADAVGPRASTISAAIATPAAAKPSAAVAPAAGAPSTLIKMAAVPHTLVGETLPATLPLNQSEPLVKAPPKPDATKAAMMQAVMPASSADMSPAALPTVSSPPAGKTIPVAKTTETRMQISASTLDSYVIRKVPAMYPPAARQARIEGVVVLTIVVNEKGNVQEVKAVSGIAVLARSAEESLRQWRFKPIMVDGKPTQVESQVSLNFQLPH